MAKTPSVKPAAPEGEDWKKRTGTNKTSIAKKKTNSKKLRQFKGRAKGRNDRLNIKKEKLDNMYVDKMK